MLERPAAIRKHDSFDCQLQTRRHAWVSLSCLASNASGFVWQVGHLHSVWLDAESLRTVALSKDKALNAVNLHAFEIRALRVQAPKLSLEGQDCRFFPTSACSSAAVVRHGTTATVPTKASVLRLPEARKWPRPYSSGVRDHAQTCGSSVGASQARRDTGFLSEKGHVTRIGQ